MLSEAAFTPLGTGCAGPSPSGNARPMHVLFPPEREEEQTQRILSFFFFFPKRKGFQISLYSSTTNQEKDVIPDEHFRRNISTVFPGFRHGKSTGTAIPLCSRHPGAQVLLSNCSSAAKAPEKWLAAGRRARDCVWKAGCQAAGPAGDPHEPHAGQCAYRTQQRLPRAGTHGSHGRLVTGGRTPGETSIGH